jgi:hypothetical protein
VESTIRILIADPGRGGEGPMQPTHVSPWLRPDKASKGKRVG